ncbi:hypothetical protein [Nocardia bovistercoris]|uniref:Uncharacterized protein n=1 Tax=Nocardia bovistercoris TaxID=2785916 RepID=A0A931IFC1_9NOCA|nr:hypothetical protein [Nocardia bovistercoris]MBH0778750.1 hypothetical protein [Nocardia bovistercoris]
MDLELVNDWSAIAWDVVNRPGADFAEMYPDFSDEVREQFAEVLAAGSRFGVTDVGEICITGVYSVLSSSIRVVRSDDS